MEGGKRELSFWVFVGFLLLFLVFMFVGSDTENTSNAIVGSIALGESPSIITLVILFVILIIVLAGVFVIFRKLKKKKVNVVTPTVKDQKEVGKETKSELGGDDIDKLFSEGEKKEEPIKAVKKEIPVKKMEQPQKKEVLTNLQDLKNKIKGMLTERLTKEQIIGRLKSHGVDVNQITKAIEEVNIDNLRGYVTQALKQGFSRDQIVRNLAVHGWKKEQISKVI